MLLNTSIRVDLRPLLYWGPLTAPGLGAATLVGANLFSRGLPLFCEPRVATVLFALAASGHWRSWPRGERFSNSSASKSMYPSAS